MGERLSRRLQELSREPVFLVTFAALAYISSNLCTSYFNRYLDGTSGSSHGKTSWVEQTIPEPPVSVVSSTPVPPVASIAQAMKVSSSPVATGTMLDMFLPGFSMISSYVGDVLGIGFDPSILGSACILAWLLMKGFQQVSWTITHLKYLLENYCTSSIEVAKEDNLYQQVLDFLAEQNIAEKNRLLMVETPWAWEDEEQQQIEASKEGELMNFSQMLAKIPLKYKLYYGAHIFRHEGRYFKLYRMRTPLVGTGLLEHKLLIRCLGFSTVPIRDFLTECRSRAWNKLATKTCVYKPYRKEDRRQYWDQWEIISERPSRPLSSVNLDEGEKQRLILDINEYLQPDTAGWYASRGIPYRRGILFHGPPGTGKSSLAFAIAGVFGLGIYTASLLDPDLTEDDLTTMLTRLPDRCVVLLEDIDSAGLRKRDMDGNNTSVGATTSSTTSAAAAVTSGSTTDKKKDEAGNKAISLSGLLNAIDGVASHEGRVLIMTTNCVEKLDAALIRPGRIDLQVEFRLATYDQMYHLFLRMYMDSEYQTAREEATALLLTAEEKEKEKERSQEEDKKSKAKEKKKATVLAGPRSAKEISSKLASERASPELKEAAARFAAALPEDTFSPAEVQGFLLTRKKEPQRALSEVAAWREEQVEIKRKRKEEDTAKVPVPQVQYQQEQEQVVQLSADGATAAEGAVAVSGEMPMVPAAQEQTSAAVEEVSPPPASEMGEAPTSAQDEGVVAAASESSPLPRMDDTAGGGAQDSGNRDTLEKAANHLSLVSVDISAATPAAAAADDKQATGIPRLEEATAVEKSWADGIPAEIPIDVPKSEQVQIEILPTKSVELVAETLVPAVHTPDVQPVAVAA